MLITYLNQRGRWSKRRETVKSGGKMLEDAMTRPKPNLELGFFPFYYDVLQTWASIWAKILFRIWAFIWILNICASTSIYERYLHTKIWPSVRPFVLPSRLESYITAPRAWNHYEKHCYGTKLSARNQFTSLLPLNQWFLPQTPALISTC